jgi:hypothetical protein
MKSENKNIFLSCLDLPVAVFSFLQHLIIYTILFPVFHVAVSSIPCEHGATFIG